MIRVSPASGCFGASTARLALLLPLLFAAPALATTEHWLTTLTLEELSHVEIGPPPTLRAPRPTDRVAAIRAGCANGHDVCDALRAVLATSKPNEDGGSVRPASARNELVSATLQKIIEPGRPRPDPSMIAGPGDAGYGSAETVDAAIRALGFGIR